MLTYGWLSEFFSYDPMTGELRWKRRKLRPGLERIDKGWNVRFEGKLAGVPDHHGHIRVRLTGFQVGYGAHRIAWVLHYKEPPPETIDHINNDPADNRICNLRAASQSQNMCNARIRCDNTSGHKGVSWSEKSKKWYAYITINKKMKGIGRFASKEEAIEARRRTAEELHGEFVRH